MWVVNLNVFCVARNADGRKKKALEEEKRYSKLVVHRDVTCWHVENGFWNKVGGHF